LEKQAGRITVALNTLGVIQVLAGLGVTCAIFLFVGHELLDIVGEEIMMPGQAIQIITILLMLLVTSSGAVSLFKVRWGWVWSFGVATIFLTMALLMGPGTIPVVKWSFLGAMVLTLINWAAAVVYYFHDLYT
jgi:hypothetical protein